MYEEIWNYEGLLYYGRNGWDHKSYEVLKYEESRDSFYGREEIDDMVGVFEIM